MQLDNKIAKNAISLCDDPVELRCYLNSLNFETIKNLQILRYLGIDWDGKIINTIKDFDNNNEWKDKDCEIRQMSGKGSLADDLSNGLKSMRLL